MLNLPENGNKPNENSVFVKGRKFITFNAFFLYWAILFGVS